MKFATFRRMKPKYKIRLVVVLLVAFALFIGLLYGLSYGFTVLSTQLNTTRLDGVTAKNLLTKPAMNSMLEILKQDDSASVLVLDSTITVSDEGAVTGLDMHLVSFKSDKGMSEYWTLFADDSTAWLRKTESSVENVNKALRIRKATLKDYYPALSRILAPNLQQYLREQAPVGAGGQYLFTDNFGDNLNPDYDSKLDAGLTGLWVSKISSVNEIEEPFTPPSDAIAAVVSFRAMEQQKGFLNSKKTVLTEPTERFVVLLEVGPF